MIHEIAHVGITVSDLEKSISFYRDVLGLRLLGCATMRGKETDRLFHRTDCVVNLAYLNGSDQIGVPPIELIHFATDPCEKVDSNLHRTSISEVCLKVEDMDRVYGALREKGVVFLSEPQFFDFSEEGLGKSKAVYFRDPDGVILELMQDVK